MYKRLLVTILVSAIFVGLTALPVQAQFTLLPKAPEGTDCIKIINEYEVSGIIKTPEQISAEQDLSQAEADYKSASEAASNNSACAVAANPEDVKGCEDYAAKKEAKSEAEVKKEEAEMAAEFASIEKFSENELLGCAIKTGRISLQMIPFFIKYISNYLLSIVGILAVLFIVIGGYMYIYGGLTENKDRGKKYIYHALLGMALALLSWVIVTIIIAAVTSPPT